MAELTAEDGRRSRIRGEASELEFARRALLLGYQVARPLVDEGFDFLVRHPDDEYRRWYTVQVKTAAYVAKSWQVDVTGGRDLNEYLQSIDYVVAVSPTTVWMIPNIEQIVQARVLHLQRDFGRYKI